jgi:hypothetical protein
MCNFSIAITEAQFGCLKHNFAFDITEAHASSSHNFFIAITEATAQFHQFQKHSSSSHTIALHNSHNCTTPYMSEAGEFAQLLLPFIKHVQALHNFRLFPQQHQPQGFTGGGQLQT